jgi:hypothetical protein
VPVTTLRVFEPLVAFPTDARPMLAALVDDPRAGQDVDELENRLAWLRLLGRPLPAESPQARLLRVNGSVLLSPLPQDSWTRRRGRHVQALEGESDETGPDGPDGDEPAGGADPLGRRGRRVAAERSAGQGAAPVPTRRHTLVRAWQLPVAWLAVVRPEDLTEAGANRYLLPISRARGRAARVLKALRVGLGEADVTVEAEALARWLEGFHGRSWVEVDARPVARLVEGDDGAEDVRLGLESLTVGDASGVAAAYKRLRRRSQRLVELSVSS